MGEVVVASGRGPYRVVIGRGLAGLGAALAGRPAPVLVTDANVGPPWADAVAAEVGATARIVIPAGEAHKTVATWERCVDGLIAAGVDRSTPVLALGGGMVGDLAGFAAATTLRGLPLVLVPTTLLAMVDSAVGGKVGVNSPRGKNLVGAFHAPALVWAALDTLSTLPGAELRSGLGEAVKTGLVTDPRVLELLEGRALADVLPEVVERCVRAKAAIVGADEREEGRRAVLNAGHTVGHALETAAGHGTLRHGEAVAIGLVAEVAFARAAGVCQDPSLLDRLRGVLARHGLPTAPPPVDRAALRAALRLDKKARADKIRVPLVVRAGEVVLVDLSRTEAEGLLP